LTSGPALFSRFAYPPNALGYCGPSDATLLTELVDKGDSAAADLRHAVTAFAGAWPYLQLISASTGRDPLDPTVVKAYWLGSPLLEQVDPLIWGNSIDERFRRRAGWDWEKITTALNAGGVPSHAFHVYCVYPWVGLLKSGAVNQALDVLDRCRIRWGRVVERANGTLLVESQPLAWDGKHLHLGLEHIESVQPPIDSEGPIQVGDLVAMHWNYICQRLSDNEYLYLRRYHDHHMAIANGTGTALVSRLEG
jgi:hypothetical protein